MYQKVQDVTLKSGEAAELGIVLGPDTTEWGTQTRSLLGHKGDIWKWQIEESLTKQHAAESRFYILSKKGKPFANIMIVEYQGIAVFGHVFTAPEERRKGAADIIHHHLMEDFVKRGGRAMYLGTGFDSPPFHLYAKHGFKGVEPKSGYMTWFREGQEAFEKQVFAAGPTRIEPLRFEHWAALPSLSMMKHPARVRIVNMGILNVVSTEGGALPFVKAMGELEKNPARRAWVAVSESSKVPVAIASVAPDSNFGDQTDIVDMFCAPGHEQVLPELRAKLNLSSDRTAVCYADTSWTDKREILQRCGFSRAGEIKRLVKSHDGAHSVEVWSK